MTPSNDKIERWHRSLKVAYYFNILPTVSDLRTCFEKDSKTFAAEMLCGTTIHIPGEYFSSDEEIPNSIYLQDKIRGYINEICSQILNVFHMFLSVQFAFKTTGSSLNSMF